MATRGLVTVSHPAERSRNGRGWFERLAEAASNFTSSAVFYGLCLALVALFAAVHAAGLAAHWQLLAFELARSSRGSGAAAGVAEIAARSGLSEREVRIGIEAIDCFSTLSTDAGVSAADDGGSLGDVLGTCDEGYDAVVDRVTLAPYLRRLPERDRTILYLHFFRGMTQTRIGELLGISQVHVSRLLGRCCAELREEIMSAAG
ncbi:sigma-70 family RNA polymerase sigma factor [Streptomyces sp. DSM 15324]|uniref:sigma-70 family RNA polymerase sigma factor n=1 Tax=Streptomyces sp. DSM 15324 TaxID=1739111 RepID=UPI0007466F0C|nr:sigma-70 family RNA polymerase sigma factor [Streptomyces sp. DSM 15324]KUO09690.1 hypothetical protein AQJ58_23240 [Streptomyces sp. DSM 15324]